MKSLTREEGTVDGGGRVGQRTIIVSVMVAVLLAAALASALVLAHVTSRKITSTSFAESAGSASPRTGNSPTLGAPTTLTTSMGLTRTQIEELFHFIDGGNTKFRTATNVKGVPRVLGGDKRLFTIVEINGAPDVVDVQVVSILDTSSKLTLENQVVYDTLTCREFANIVAQRWCTSRVLNTNSSGLVTATASKTFNGLEITVRTFRSATKSFAPVVSIDVRAR
ncbi:MAG: hypothetical protein ACYCPT_05600 [Acidimicrobiales bacterium]